MGKTNKKEPVITTSPVSLPTQNINNIAESEGFKPPIPERGIPDFESSAIDHSANSPLSFCGCKVNNFSRYHQRIYGKLAKIIQK